jgi:hypothetical protein
MVAGVAPDHVDGGAIHGGRARFAHQRQVAYGQHALVGGARAAHDAVAVAEGVELLHIAQAVPGLPLHPGTQARLQGTVLRLQASRRQRIRHAGVARAHGQHLALVTGDGHHHRTQVDVEQVPGGAARMGGMSVGAHGCAFYAPLSSI